MLNISVTNNLRRHATKGAGGLVACGLLCLGFPMVTHAAGHHWTQPAMRCVLSAPGVPATVEPMPPRPRAAAVLRTARTVSPERVRACADLLRQLPAAAAAGPVRAAAPGLASTVRREA